MSKEPKTEAPGHEAFVGALTDFLMARQGANVLVLVEVPGHGIESFTNTTSFCWCDGALRAGLRLMQRVEERAIVATAPEVSRIEQQEQERIEDAVEQSRKKAN